MRRGVYMRSRFLQSSAFRVDLKLVAELVRITESMMHERFCIFFCVLCVVMILVAAGSKLVHAHHLLYCNLLLQPDIGDKLATFERRVTECFLRKETVV